MSDEYYADTARRLDTIIGGDTSHFLRLQRVRNEYDELARAVPVDIFPELCNHIFKGGNLRFKFCHPI